MAWQGLARLGGAWSGRAWQGMARLGWSRQGVAGQGMARRGKAWIRRDLDKEVGNVCGKGRV